MRKRALSFLFVICVILTLIPGISTASAIEPITDAVIQDRINELNHLLGSKYFTTDGKSAPSNSDKSKPSNIVKAKWFKEMFGNIEASQMCLNQSKSCVGFVGFASWYIFRSDDTDHVLLDQKSEIVGKFNYKDVSKNAHIGDYIYVFDTGKNSKGVPYGHAFIYVGTDSTGVTVLDSNGGNSNCKVQLRTIKYNNSNFENHKMSIRTFKSKTAGYPVRGATSSNPSSPQTNPPITYVTITFDPNGGTVSPSTQKIVKGSDPTNLPKPIRKGYTFKGWILDKVDPDNPPLNSSSGIITENSAWGFSKDTTIYAYWVKDTISEKKFTVTLDDGSICKQITVTSGGTYSNLTTPSKDGYTFDGWYTAKMGGTKITSSAKVNLTGDQTLYAHWIKIPVEENPFEPEPPIMPPQHNHSGSFKYAESSHPHLNHYICSTCGADYTDGSTSPDKKCDQCWGPWSVWSYTPAYSSETRQVESQHTETQVEVAKGYTEYRYGGYATSDGSHECWCDTYLRSKFGSANLRYSDWSTTRYRENGKGWSCGQCSGNHIHVGHYDDNGNAWWPEYTLPGGKNYYWEETRTVPAQYETHVETVYRYRDWTHG